MSKIEKLTPEQEAQVPIWYDEWYKVGTCTEPADRETAEKTATEMLKIAGKWNNQKMVWCKSPFVAEVLINFLRDIRSNHTGNPLGDSLCDSLRYSLWDSLRYSLWDSLVDSLRGSLGASIGSSIWASLVSSISKIKMIHNGTWFDGHIDAYWICFYKFCQDVVGVKYKDDDRKKLSLHESLCRSCGRVYFYEKMVILCERPSEIHFKGKVLHNDKGMSVKYPDGWGFYNLNGITVSEELVMTPAERLDVKKWVLEEKSVDVQREAIRKIGAERVLQKLKAKPIDEWTYRERYNYKLMRLSLGENVDRKYLYYEAASIPGVYYCQPVPPETTKAMHGLAWMRGLCEQKELGSIDVAKEAEIIANLPEVIS